MDVSCGLGLAVAAVCILQQVEQRRDTAGSCNSLAGLRAVVPAPWLHAPWLHAQLSVLVTYRDKPTGPSQIWSTGMKARGLAQGSRS